MILILSKEERKEGGKEDSSRCPHSPREAPGLAWSDGECPSPAGSVHTEETAQPMLPAWWATDNAHFCLTSVQCPARDLPSPSLNRFPELLPLPRSSPGQQLRRWLAEEDRGPYCHHLDSPSSSLMGWGTLLLCKMLPDPGQAEEPPLCQKGRQVCGGNCGLCKPVR